MRMRHRKEGYVNVIACSGAMYTGEGANLFYRMVESMIDDGERRFVFDFGKVPWMDSGAIGLVFAAGQKIRALDGRVTVVSSRKLVDEIWIRAQLKDALDVQPDVDTAVRCVAS